MSTSASRSAALEQLAAKLDAVARQDNWDMLLAEFGDLRNPVAVKFDPSLARVATADVNKPRNRYLNVLAYDHTRVKLADVEAGESDYVNANFMQAPECKARYIAAQAPLRDTFAHFWQMVWEADVRVVAMLTPDIEQEQLKSDRYWPQLGMTQRYGRVSVTVESESKTSSYVSRALALRWLGTGPSSGTRESDNAPMHSVTHLHYLRWPDQGVPSPADSFTAFRQLFREAQGAFDVPAVVHCSAGCGRTGSFCVIDSAIDMVEHGYTKANVIHRVVDGFRGQRVGMVQTFPQYVFCHVAVAQAIRRLLL
eukprot:Unigene8254_Nuclearia_a/m.25347 Unigene8254_Nuclearia_a/g.25347  ORF Unigene8254_Nuclearia_a/g.25347 Unigene8254_Nuclearia_a/m.25347 type:complete len:310 (-) Unigene8254_Nuclearia_a:101-1030(-)